MPDLSGFDGTRVLLEADQLADAEIAISRAVLRYARDARGGRLNPQSLSKNLDPTLALPAPSEVLGSMAFRSDAGAYLRSFQPDHPQFEALRQALIAARGGKVADAPEPGVTVIPEGPLLKLGMEHPQVALLRTRLEMPAKPGGNENLFDQDVREAVVQFQRTQGASADGIVGSGTRRMLNGGVAPQQSSNNGQIDLLLANMERWRWLPRDPGAFYVTVNIPEFMLRVVEDGAVIHETRVVTGKTNKQTPVFSDEMEEIVFNPYWFVPQSIKSEEIAPYLHQAGGFFGGGWDTSVLRRHNLRIRGANGRDIDPDRVDWSSNDIRRYELYQPPGPSNVLGTMKFVFPNTHDVYMHDTTQKHLFANAVRAESHGCMRVQYPDQVATLLLGRDQGWTAEHVAAAVRGGPDNQVALKQPIPVHITYFTAKVNEDGTVSTFRDLYGHDTRIIAALAGKPVPQGLPGVEVAQTKPRVTFQRGRRDDAINGFARALFGF